MKTPDEIAFRYVRRFWVNRDVPDLPGDMVDAFTFAHLATLRGQRLCVAVACRQLFRELKKVFL